MHHSTERWSWPAAFVTLAVFTAPATQASPVSSLLELRQQNVVIQRWDVSCGAAALATVVRYQYGTLLTEKQVVLGLLRHTSTSRVQRRGGFSLLDMKRYLASQGFDGRGYAGLSLADLIQRAPVIIPIEMRGYRHFVVFRGIARGRAVIADPAFGNRSLSLSSFNMAWRSGIGFSIQPDSGGTWPNLMQPGPRDLLRVPDQALRSVIKISSDASVMPVHALRDTRR